eukprot:355842-Chlamydomonas_euryale.AAC.6
MCTGLRFDGSASPSAASTSFSAASRSARMPALVGSRRSAACRACAARSGQGVGQGGVWNRAGCGTKHGIGQGVWARSGCRAGQGEGQGRAACACVVLEVSV